MTPDPNEPTADVLKACACPIDWKGLAGFGDACPDALDLLHHEWIRCMAEVSVASEELRLIEDVLFDGELYEPPDNSTLVNLRERKPKAEKLYCSRIGRLGRLKFIRPSEHGKHFSVTGRDSKKHRISRFYKDLQAETIAELFWSWFSDMMLVQEEPRRTGPIDFLRNVGPLWDRFCRDRKIRIAIDVVSPIGELKNQPLSHIAIDLDLKAAVAHAYPISATEADAIMKPFPVRQVKSREY